MTELKKVAREAAVAVLPIVIAVSVLQFTLVFMPVVDFVRFLLGSVLVFAGLAIFLLGVRVGLMRMGEVIGAKLPERQSLLLLLGTAFLISFVVTAAEPDVRVLAYQVRAVSGGQVGNLVLVLMVAMGVGIFIVFGMLRIVFDVPISHLFVGGYAAVFILSFFTPPQFVPVSFDAGGVTTGPLTVPFLLSFGVGVASVLGREKTLADSFGLIGLASVGPIISVMLMGVLFA